jgi:peptidoglycan/LPS O-acetylase OafA/YrhL
LAVLLVNVIAFAMSIAIALVSWNLFEKQWLKLKYLPFLQREDEPVLEATEKIRNPLLA